MPGFRQSQAIVISGTTSKQLKKQSDARVIGYGTMLLSNAWRAAEELATQKISAAVIDLPWLNRIDDQWVFRPLGTHAAKHGRALGERFPPDRHALFAMVAPSDLGTFERVVAEHGGTLSMAMTQDELTRAGLPPTPIAMPGVAALQAVQRPPASDKLYFVARGDGSSVFSDNLDDHNRAVNKYQRAVK